MSHRGVLAILLTLASASLLSAQVPAGDGFVVSSPLYSHFALRQPAIALDPAGGYFLVAWESIGCVHYPTPCHAQDGGTGIGGVFARRYDGSGAPQGAEFQVNAYTTGRQGHPVIASDGGGNVVVVWDGSGEGDPFGGIFGRLYDASGAPRGAEFRVNSYTTWHQGYPAVASDASGNFVVAWRSFGQDGDDMGVFAQRFDATGTALGQEFQVNTYTTAHQGSPSVAIDATGDFVVVWEDRSRVDTSRRGVFGQRYDASGSPRGAEFRVNTYGAFVSWADPKVVSDAAGNLVIVWSSLWPSETAGIRGQLYDSSGAPRGGEFQIDGSAAGFPTGFPGSPSVSMDAGGAFVVTWLPARARRSWGGPYYGQPPAQVSGRRFEASGAPRGAEFTVSRCPNSSACPPSRPVVAVSPAGDFVATWTGGQSVWAQRLGNIEPAALSVDDGGGLRPGDFGNGVLEPGEAVDVRPSFRNLNGLAQPVAFSGHAASFTGPEASGVGYAVPDATASYGPIANGATGICEDCYRAGVFYGGVRPALHWDATLIEELSLDPSGQALRRSMHVGESFADVPRTSPYYRFVETLLHHGVTGGCSATEYCPAGVVTREQMAAFTLVGKEGAGYVPDSCYPWRPPLFADVPTDSPFCLWIEELANRGVVSGCGGGNYCPGGAVTREQMPIFVLKTLDPAIDPPACTTPVFADVPASSPYCRFIEELVRRGVVGGCGGGNYCPGDPVTREQMAVFISQTFGLSLYGP